MSDFRRLRCTPAQLATWKAAAQAEGQSLEEWLVEAADCHAARKRKKRAPVLRLRVLKLARKGKRPAEIAKACGTTVASVSSVLSVARKNGELPPLTVEQRLENARTAAQARARAQRAKWFSKCLPPKHGARPCPRREHPGG